jgi:hypothetical protein
MSKRKLTDNEERVLLCLYERRDSDQEIPFEKIVASTGLSPKEVRSSIRGLTEAGMIGGNGPDLLREATDALMKMQPEIQPTARGYSENIILVASILAKADEAFLANELSYDPEFVAVVGSRLRAAGIWKGGAISERHLNDWKKDSTAYFLDCAVAAGDLMIVGENSNGDLLFQMTSSGKGHVEKLLGRPQ